MKKPDQNIADAALLRQKAEDQLKKRSAKASLVSAEPDMLKLIHELEVHQIELELQNEELILANQRANEASEKYEALYDFAPSGYFTLSRKGNILEMNLRGAQMLGKERSFLINSPFDSYIEEESRSVFGKFLEEIFQGKNNTICDVSLRCKDDTHLHLHLTGIISEASEQCLVTAIDLTERKHFEEKNRRNLERFRTLVDVSLAGIWATDPLGNNTYVSPQWSRITGISPDEAKGEGWCAGLHPDDRTLIMNDWKIIGPENKPKTYDFRFIRPDGSMVWVLSQANVVKDSDGKIIEWIGTTMDITERKKAEEELRKNLAKYKVLIDTFPIAITLSDPEGNIVETNEKALELLGLSREEHLKRKLKGEEWKIIKPDGAIFPPEEYASVKALKENRLVENVEMGIAKSGGETTWLNVTAAPVPIEDFGVLIAYNDITRRRQMENVLRENEQRLRFAMKATNDVVWDWDIVNDKQRWNEAGEKVFGWTEIVKNAVSASWWTERIHPDDRKKVEEGFYAAVQNKSDLLWQDEYRFRKSDGTYAEVLDRGYVLRDNQGKAIRMIGAMLDNTERKNAELALIESELFPNTIASSTPALLYLYDFEKGKNIWANDAHQRFFENLTKDSANSDFSEISQFTHPDDFGGLIKITDELLNNTSMNHFEFEHRLKWNGTWKWMNIDFHGKQPTVYYE